MDAEEILDGILSWVHLETPSQDAAAVNALVDLVETDLRVHGARVDRLPGRDGWGDILRARSPWGGDGPGVLFLGHLDTVHPIGTKADVNPIRREGDKVFGPGIYDMKAGSYLGYHAYRHLAGQGVETPLPITLLLVSEEEVGSPISRAVIEDEAARAKYVLVAEPARDGGKIVTARKGVARFDLEVTGRPSHAGSRHQDGRSAIREMAHQILALEAMTDYDRGITVSVGMVQGGTAVNVIPFSCRAEVDMRVPDAATGEEMVAKVLGLQPVGPDVEVRVSGGLNRPPFEKGAGITALFDHARALAAEIGFELVDTHTGGGSDGNFTAALGVPTLDGLGADGAGAHTHHEHILV
ncbi:MAG: M20/M25/M40 family metallo-hydrolase, partial [Rhodobacterales bacterium]|nr:M20/M25/M40 family metallo-hydrolase [Rhodobacterales bacterium]